MRSFASIVDGYLGFPLADANDSAKLLNPIERAKFDRGNLSFFGVEYSVNGTSGGLGYLVPGNVFTYGIIGGGNGQPDW